MYSIKQVFSRNPVQISAAVIGVVNFAVIMDWISMTGEQVGGLNTAIAGVLGVFVVNNTVNSNKLAELAAAEEEDLPEAA